MSEVTQAVPENSDSKQTSKFKDKMLRFFSTEYRKRAQTSELRANLRHLRQRYGLSVNMHRLLAAEQEEGLSMEKLNLNEATAAVEVINDEIGKYPPEYFKILGINGIRLTKTLGLGKQTGDGLVHKGKMYLSPNGPKHHFQRVIHHELYHLADLSAQVVETSPKPIESDGFISRFRRKYLSNKTDSVSHQNPPKQTLDEEWTALNPEGRAAYGKYILRDYALDTSKRGKGFTKPYGCRNPKEDRATIAEELMTDPQRLFKWAEDDPILDRKVNFIINLYQERSSGVLDREYFEILATGAH